MRIVGRASSPRKGWPPATAQRAADGLDMATTRDRDCSGSSTLAPGSHNGNIRANSSYIGKKLRIQTGIDSAKGTDAGGAPDREETHDLDDFGGE